MRWGKIVGCVLGFYGILSIAVGEWSPVKYYEQVQERKEQRILNSKYREVLYGQEGFIDKNTDGKISFEEKLHAYEKLGLEGRIDFKFLSTEDMRKLIEMYESERKSLGE